MTIRLVTIRSLKKTPKALLTAFCLGGMLWTAACGRRPYYLKGDVISLIDRWNMVTVGETSLIYPERRIDEERLDEAWRLLSRLPNGVMIWETHASLPIDSSREAPALRRGSKRIQPQEVLSTPDTPAGRWAWSGNRIWLTTDRDPSREGYLLSYYPAPRPKRMARKRLVLDRRESRLLPAGLRFYPLNVPVIVERTGARPRHVSVLRDGVKIPFEPRLGQYLDRDGRPPDRSPGDLVGWIYIEGSRIWLFRADEGKAQPLFKSGDGFKERLFLSSGPAKVVIRARGGLAGEEPPRLAIYLDKALFGEASISSEESRDYEVEGFVPQGEHTLRLVFMNDFYDRERGLDRNIFLEKVDIRYLDGIVLSGDSAEASLTIDFPLLPWGASSRRPQISDYDLNGDIRKAIICFYDTAMAFSIDVPPQGCLSFCSGTLSAESVQKNHWQITVRIKPKGGRPRDLLSTSVAPDSWQNHRLDLSAFSGLKAELVFEIKSDPGLSSQTPSLAIGNPLVLSKRPESRRPPVIIFQADSMRADHLGCYGYDRETSPFMDAFARDSVLFEKAISQAPWTLPSITSLMTSLYPSFHLIMMNDSRLASGAKTLAEFFKDEGYLTAAFVDNDFLDHIRGLGQGFDRYHTASGRVNLGRRLSLAEEWAANVAPQSFLLYFHTYQPHAPYRAPLRFAEALGVKGKEVTPQEAAAALTAMININKRSQVLASRERQDLIDAYDAEIRHLDDAFGRFIQNIKQQGLYDSSIIVLTSDHGEEFQEHGYLLHGHSLYQGAIHVPLLIKFPDRYHFRGLRISPYVQMIDILPTLLEACGLTTDQDIQGRSLLPLCSSEDAPDLRERVVLSETHQGVVSILEGRYKYIFYPRQNREELYDLEKDPKEKVNGIDLWPEVRDSFRKKREDLVILARNYGKRRSPEEKIVISDKDIERLHALGYLR